MSGICGIVRFDGAPASPADLDRMMRALRHLGPDRSDKRHDGVCAMGALTMRVTHEDAFSLQPLHHESLSFVSDARLDNREELAAALGIGDAALVGMADSALAFAAWRDWGEGCVDRMIGDFVFAAWDGTARKLVLGRDHMGQRHVMFHRGEGFFAFATEKKGLWALPQIPRVLSDAMIARPLGLGFEQSQERASGDSIDAVRGGSLLTLDAQGNVATRRYWEPRADPAHENRDEAYYVEAYRRVLGEAVACRLRRATTPAGLFMGGGFDSSAICGLAGPVVTRQGRKFVAASSVMPADYAGTIRHARKWVEMCRRHMPHLDIRYVTREGIDIFTGMEAGFHATDSGHSSNRFVNDALYAVIKGAGCRVVMDGHGGDYTLNPRAQRFLFDLLRKGQFRRLAREWRTRKRWLRASHGGMFFASIMPFLFPGTIARRGRVRAGLPAEGPTMPASAEILAEIKAGGAMRRHDPARSTRDGMLRALRLQQDSAALGGSIAAATHGLELTQPYHDKRVVELGLAVPEHLYFGNGRERYLARKAFADFYPPEYQDRPPGNDDLGPDFLAMAKRIGPRVLAEIDRMEAAGKLTRYFDFPRMRAMLTRRQPDQHASGNEYDTRQAMLAFLHARYIEWFRGENA